MMTLKWLLHGAGLSGLCNPDQDGGNRDENTRGTHTAGLGDRYEGDVSRFLENTVGWLEVSTVKLGGEKDCGNEHNAFSHSTLRVRFPCRTEVKMLRRPLHS